MIMKILVLYWKSMYDLEFEDWDIEAAWEKCAMVIETAGQRPATMLKDAWLKCVPR